MFEYSNHLNTRLVWYSNGRFVSGRQMVRNSNGGLKTGQKKLVYGPKCPVFEWSAKASDYYLKTRHPYCTPCTVFRWIRYSGVQYSNGHYNLTLHTCLETGYKKPVLLRLVLQIPSHITVTVLKKFLKMPKNAMC